jgi:iron complex outermembrane receptor protein
MRAIDLSLTLVLVAAAFAAKPVWAAGLPDEEELLNIYGSERVLSIATGRRQSISRAPAVASVITAEDIQKIGARDLDEVLETIPGLHVSVSPVGYNPIYTIRGIYSEFNSQVLMLFNGVPITTAFIGDRGQVWGGMPVQGIERIEVLRGPGSALYGADAYAGVINIITWGHEGEQQHELGARAGSFDYGGGWGLSRVSLGGWKLSAYLEYAETDGFDEEVGADAQTTFDQATGTSASHAPDQVNVGRRMLDTRFELAKGNWLLRVGYQGRRDVETGAGVGQALDPDGQAEADRFLVDIVHRNPQLAQDWDLTTQFNFYDVADVSRLVLFPPGSDYTALGGGAFPEGVIGNPDVYERHWRLALAAHFSGWDDHELSFGTGVHYEDMYRIRESRNYSLTPQAVPVPLGQLVNVSDSVPFIRPHDRTVLFGYVQDEWGLATDWSLTTGLRYDHYSDAGSTFNPRVALVWQANYALTAKLLYGRAFRAPSFAEQFNINNPVALGNPDLDPETIDTLELAFDTQVNDALRMGLNVFYYRMQDIIRFVDDPGSTTKTARNAGEQTGYGLEYEINWSPWRRLSLVGNYAFQQSRDEDLNADPGFAPHHQVYLRTDWQPVFGIHVIPQINYVADRDRAKNDSRDPVDDYATLDLTLRWKPKRLQSYEFTFSGRNLLDENVEEPSPSSGLIPGDLPMSGRQLFGEIKRVW